MARKSSQQRQRELNQRGRSIPAASKEMSDTVENEESLEVRNPNERGTGPDVEEEGNTKNIHDIVGIPEMVVETEDEEETDEEIEESEDEDEIVSDSLEQGNENLENDTKTESDDMLQLQNEDVEEEVEYWKQAVICFILGANPPWEIVEGFIRRIWTKYNIDKISFLPNGIFLVRFKTMEMKEKVLTSGHYLFDNKPMIVKSWEKDLEMKKGEVKSVPAWIRIHKLPLKFWGKSLPKITSIVGKYIKSDVATEERTRLGFARVMVELLVDQHLPAQVSFKDETGGIVQVEVEYEWRPVTCTKCKGMGHDMEQCRKGEQKKPSKVPVKQVWKPVSKKTGNAIEPVQVRQLSQEQTRPVSAVRRQAPEHHTPIKRLVRMHSREGSTDGYSNENFGAFSYKEVVASPAKKSSEKNGLFGLLETKIKNKAFNKAAGSFNNWCITTNNGYHSGGRIWVLWNPTIFRVQILEYNAQYIHLKVDSLVDRRVFWLTMTYAFNVVGDFNCVLSPSERVGGNAPSGEIEPFRRCVADCGLVDIAAIGAVYTWNNKQKHDERIYSRIDRFMVNKAWCDNFTDLYAHFMPEGLYDHTPCVVKSSNQGQSKRSFKYFNMWGGSKKFLPLVRGHWDTGMVGTPMFRLVKSLKRLKPVLKKLNLEGYSDIEGATNILQKQVEEMQEEITRDPTNLQLISEEYEATLKLQELTKAKESFLTQKAKHQWA
ncbi:uncharacterized protein LOC141601533 [Silene latifolia]|uniref:uncharacterized protein LOC141601533 n=1 Tax=Silene latifolia TaxID=37657 RepID=UPI003D785E7A